jgi:hypothetical protein
VTLQWKIVASSKRTYDRSAKVAVDNCSQTSFDSFSTVLSYAENCSNQQTLVCVE